MCGERKKETNEQVSIRGIDEKQAKKRVKEGTQQRQNQMNCINKIKILISCVLKWEKLDYFTCASI